MLFPHGAHASVARPAEWVQEQGAWQQFKRCQMSNRHRANVTCSNFAQECLVAACLQPQAVRLPSPQSRQTHGHIFHGLTGRVPQGRSNHILPCNTFASGTRISFSVQTGSACQRVSSLHSSPNACCGSLQMSMHESDETYIWREVSHYNGRPKEKASAAVPFFLKRLCRLVTDLLALSRKAGAKLPFVISPACV